MTPADRPTFSLPSKPMGLIKFFKAQWADAEKSGNWMADAPEYRALSVRQRRAIEDQPRGVILRALLFAVVPVVVVVGLVIYLVIEAFT
jgi:hypothetical protein